MARNPRQFAGQSLEFVVRLSGDTPFSCDEPSFAVPGTLLVFCVADFSGGGKYNGPLSPQPEREKSIVAARDQRKAFFIL
jgi:hypothetical protein